LKLLKEQKEALQLKRADQSEAVRKGKSTKELVKEIVELRVDIEGTETGLKDLEAEILSIGQGRAKELNTFRLSRMAETNKDALQIQDEIYTLLFEAANKTEDLKEKYRAYRSDLKSGDHHTLSYVQLKREHLIAKLVLGLPSLMDIFPNEIIVSKGITPTDLRRKLSK
jgi:hypothetical protein